MVHYDPSALAADAETALSLVDAPVSFSEAVQRLGINTVAGHSARDISEAAALSESMGYPVFASRFLATGHHRQGIVYNVEELRQILAESRPPMETTGTFRIEEAPFRLSSIRCGTLAR